MQTVYDLVRLAALRTPEHFALVDDRAERRLRYRELMTEIEALAQGFGALGIRPGVLVATLLPNLFEHALALLALHRLGAVPALINPRLKPEEAAELIRRGSMAGAILLPAGPLVGALTAALPAGAPVITVGGGLAGSIAFDEVARRPAPPLPPFWFVPESPAFVFHTSGTTGLPKGVMISHRATDGRLLYMSMQCGIVHGTHNRAIGLMPLFHVVGFYSVLVNMLAMNGTYYCVSAFDPKAAVETIARERITLVYGAPTHFHALLGAPDFAPERVRSVETLVYAGAPMPGPLLARVGAAFVARITNIYGTTEVMNALYMRDPVGRPDLYRPGFYSNVRVVRLGAAVDQPAAMGEEGEVVVDISADASFSGYLGDPAATAEKVERGWYRTGDIAIARADGDLELRGRVDDMILSGGENVHPGEIETVLLAHPAVKDVAVIGLPDERWGQGVIACIVAQGPAPAAEALDGFCRESALANYKRPRRYVFVAEIPRNAANKTLRRALRDIVAAQT